ncbi:MAG: alpha/beta hydrolase [Mogibacterium sp.]|nr:alpha/beta hydrolase [Mogibacterium sp.]MBQ5959339.1 alpha/beta hydrolase [Bacillota bacterium]
MIYKEYGTVNNETIVLLHGGGLSWWNYREAAGLLAPDFHVILPVLDGHAGSGRAFTSIEDNAAEIIDFIDQNLNGRVLMIGGLSLGAQIVLEMLSQKKDICRYALVESAAVIPSKITNALIGPAFGSSYGLIRNKSFARLQFKSLRMKPELFEDYYRDTCRISKTDMIAFMKANTAYSLNKAIRESTAEVHVFIGEKETHEILSSADVIVKKIPNAELEILPGLYHGEFSINHADDFADKVKSIVRK